MPTLPKFKKIVDYTDQELEDSINYAKENIPGFFDILRGVDAYMEKRKRKEALASVKEKKE